MNTYKKYFFYILSCTFFVMIFWTEPVHGQNVCINTTGAANTTNSMLEVLQPSVTNNTVGIFARHSGAATNAYALWAEVTAGTNKYAFVVPPSKGFVGIGTITPTTLFHVDGGVASTTQTIATLTANSLTTGKGLLITSSSVTSGNLLEIQANNATSNAAYTSNGLFVQNDQAYGNAIQAVTTDSRPNYSAIFADATPTVAGGLFSISSSNHAIAGQVNGTMAYSFGIFGRVVSSPVPSGGVIGYYAATDWGALGYHSLAAVSYGAYFSTVAGNGAGRYSSSPETPAIGVGFGSYGDLFGGWVRGNVYGLALQGDRCALYVNGRAVVNQPIVELASPSVNADRKPYYSAVSQNSDVYERGTATLSKGEVTVQLTDDFLKQASTDDISIIITPMGATQGVYYELKEKNTFLIKENNNGTSSVKVSWMAFAKRNTENKKQNFPNELLPYSFDSSLDKFMFNENNISGTPGNLWWDGHILNTTTPPVLPKE